MALLEGTSTRLLERDHGRIAPVGCRPVAQPFSQDGERVFEQTVSQNSIIQG
jgi:hypothetical protein